MSSPASPPDEGRTEGLPPSHIVVRSGARAGHRIPLRTSPARLGRGPDLEVALDPHRDLEVSALHAELRWGGADWSLRDLGSRNGTFLNGRRLGVGSVRVDEGDRIELGSGGPVLEFCSAGVAPASGSVTQRFRAHVHRETRRLRGAVVILALALVAVAAALVARADRERAAWDRERTALEARADSLLEAGARTVRSFEGELEELAAALERSRGELEEIRRVMAAATSPSPPGSPARGADGGDEAEWELRDRLRDVTAALERQQIAASLDFDAIQAANRRAIAILFVERGDGSVATGTAFAVEPDGTMITSRHVILGEEGAERPLRLAVQFTDSRQVFPARLLAASTEWDVATIAVENLIGDVPVVAGLNLRPDTLYSGAPVASLGFPLGGEAAAAAPGADRPLARPLLSAGVLLGRDEGRLEVQGYGEPGASGSPLFDRDGAVLGILSGGRREGDRRVLVAVPSSALGPLLRATGEGGG